MATKWTRNTEVIWEELNGEALVVSPTTGQRWSFNATAAGIWKMCDGCTSLLRLSKAFAQASGRGLAQSREEIREFCAALSNAGLLCPAGNQSVQATNPNVIFMSGLETPPMFRPLGAGGGSRRRPSPRGNSGPG